MSISKVAYINTIEDDQPCVLCQKPTKHRAVWKPLVLFEVRKAVCPGCINDFMGTARFAGRLLSTLETNTKERDSGEGEK